MWKQIDILQLKDKKCRRGLKNQSPPVNFSDKTPFKLIGGIAKGHPDQTNMEGVLSFIKDCSFGW